MEPSRLGGQGLLARAARARRVLARGDDLVPIPGTKRHRYLEDNLGALDVTLDEADLRRIDAVMPPGAAEGPRGRDMTSMNR